MGLRLKHSLPKHSSVCSHWVEVLHLNQHRLNENDNSLRLTHPIDAILFRK